MLVSQEQAGQNCQLCDSAKAPSVKKLVVSHSQTSALPFRVMDLGNADFSVEGGYIIALEGMCFSLLQNLGSLSQQSLRQ